LAELAQSRWHPFPTTLIVQECPKACIGVYGYDAARGIIPFIRSELCRSVQTLAFRLYGISERTVTALLAPDCLEQLTQLTFDYCWMAPESIELLRARFGSRLVISDPQD
jgi:hypothetical protein